MRVLKTLLEVQNKFSDLEGINSTESRLQQLKARQGLQDVDLSSEEEEEDSQPREDSESDFNLEDMSDSRLI